ncbi:MAG: class I SAM-dependent methyltransferase [Desulfobacterota bacterium]|nr:class I SAM-dependent methyltransferase [Thermodesulfobacteriota bacterium]
MTEPRSEAHVFRQVYADHYDLFYAEKDYEAECDMLEEVFRRYGKAPIRTILDLGCGTGNHAFPLAERGYEVTGVDRSGDMLGHALLQSLALGRTFDVVLMMFAVLGYQLTNDDVLAALQTVRNHLKPGGLFICDVWYGPAVLVIRPEDKIKIIPTENGKVIRIASGSLDTYHHLATVNYHILHLSGQAVVSETTEAHLMRYFFPQELNLFMAISGLRLLGVRAFSDLERTPSDTTWNTLVFAELKE